MSETPTTTTSQKSIAIHLPFVLQYASNLYRSAFCAPYALRKGKCCQYSSHLYRSTPPICIAIRLPFVSQYFWEDLGGCGHRDAPQTTAACKKTIFWAFLGHGLALFKSPSGGGLTKMGSVPSDTKLLLTKNYFEIFIFEKLRISRVISGKSLSFPEILRGQIPSKITKNNSQGIIFVIILSQRVTF